MSIIWAGLCAAMLGVAVFEAFRFALEAVKWAIMTQELIAQNVGRDRVGYPDWRIRRVALVAVAAALSAFCLLQWVAR